MTVVFDILKPVCKIYIFERTWNEGHWWDYSLNIWIDPRLIVNGRGDKGESKDEDNTCSGNAGSFKHEINICS